MVGIAYLAASVESGLLWSTKLVEVETIDANLRRILSMRWSMILLEAGWETVTVEETALETKKLDNCRPVV